MLRRAAVAVVVVGLIPAPVFSQDTTFAVSAASAEVYKAPSTGSPIVGRVASGAELLVMRELGSWVRVAWPDAEDGAGYIHVTRGRIVNGRPAESIRAAAGDAVRSLAQDTAPGRARPAAPAMVVARAGSSTPLTHRLGVGAGLLSGTPNGFAATARWWRSERIGARVDVARYASPLLPAGSFTTLHVEPSLLVSMTDRVTNYFWFRPYAGAGVSLRRHAADRPIGIQAFGGSEVSFAGAPQLALSADFGYRSRQSAFDTLRVGGYGLSVSAHWYVR